LKSFSETQEALLLLLLQESSVKEAMSWLKSAISRAAEVGAKTNNLTRTARTFADAVIQQAAGGAKIVQDRLVRPHIQSPIPLSFFLSSVAVLWKRPSPSNSLLYRHLCMLLAKRTKCAFGTFRKNQSRVAQLRQPDGSDCAPLDN
jgi:hypothetical protein